MQSAYMYIDLHDGAGWRSVTDHTGDVAALESFTIDWGTDGIDQQPEPAVMSFQLIDRTGRLAGKAARIAGATVLVQITPEPPYAMLDAAAYRAQGNRRLADLPAAYEPPPPDNPANSNRTIYIGIVTTGGEIDHSKGTAWRLTLSATSLMVLWKRAQDMGPTSTDPKLAGYHWALTAGQRSIELNRRARVRGMPGANYSGLVQPDGVRAYSMDEYPSMLDLLHREYATDPRIPLWYDHYDRNEPELRAALPADVASLILDGSMCRRCRAGDVENAALDGHTIRADRKFTLPEPYTQLVMKTHGAAISNEGVAQYNDTQVIMGARGLPDGLMATQKSLTLESDVLTKADPKLTGIEFFVWTPTAEQRDVAARTLTAADTIIRPAAVTLDSRDIDPAEFPDMFAAQPVTALCMTNTVANQLHDDAGRPSFTGPWILIAGVLSYRWTDGKPVFRHEVTLWPMPQDTTAPSWNAIRTWPAVYADGDNITLTDLMYTNIFDNTKETT